MSWDSDAIRISATAYAPMLAASTRDMKQGLLTLTFLLVTDICYGQYVGHATLRHKVTKDTLVDNELKMKFILDSARIFISAFDSNHKLIWCTDPWTDNRLSEYRVKRSVIVRYGFVKNEWTDGIERIWIVYNNTQFGTVDKLTGKFKWLGQD